MMESSSCRRDAVLHKGTSSVVSICSRMPHSVPSPAFFYLSFRARQLDHKPERGGASSRERCHVIRSPSFVHFPACRKADLVMALPRLGIARLSSRVRRRGGYGYLAWHTAHRRRVRDADSFPIRRLDLHFVLGPRYSRHMRPGATI